MSFHFEKAFLDFRALSLYSQYQTSKAKKIHLKTFPECAICGSTRDLEVHHINPVHLSPELAIDPNNFITLCDSTNNGCHRWFGHFGNFTRLFNIYVREYAMCNRLFLEIMRPERKFVIKTSDLELFFSESMRMSIIEFKKHYMGLAKNIFTIDIV